MLQLLIRILLTIPAFIADILHLFVLCTLLITLRQERGLMYKVPEGFRHNHFPTLGCLWGRPWFSNK